MWLLDRTWVFIVRYVRSRYKYYRWVAVNCRRCREITSFDDLKGSMSNTQRWWYSEWHRFFILPDGYPLTCHHVVFGLRRLRVKLYGEIEPRDAEYIKEYSDPIKDFAVLKVSGINTKPVQLAALRVRTEAYGLGFRPSTLSAELNGHLFSGKLEPGQKLQLRPSNQLKNRSQDMTSELQKLPWSDLPQEFRIGNVFNFQASGF